MATPLPAADAVLTLLSAKRLQLTASSTARQGAEGTPPPLHVQQVRQTGWPLGVHLSPGGTGHRWATSALSRYLHARPLSVPPRQSSHRSRRNDDDGEDDRRSQAGSIHAAARRCLASTEWGIYARTLCWVTQVSFLLLFSGPSSPMTVCTPATFGHTWTLRHRQQTSPACADDASWTPDYFDLRQGHSQL